MLEHEAQRRALQLERLIDKLLPERVERVVAEAGHVADTERRAEVRRHDQLDLLEHLHGRHMGRRSPFAHTFPTACSIGETHRPVAPVADGVHEQQLLYLRQQLRLAASPEREPPLTAVQGVEALRKLESSDVTLQLLDARIRRVVFVVVA